MSDIEKIDNSEIVELNFDYFVDNDVVISSGPGELPPATTKTPNKRRNVVAKKKSGTEIAEDGQEVVNMSSMDSYAENMNELKKTVLQFDALANELKEDLDNVRSSRTLKGKYQYTSLIAGNLSTILQAKVNAIKEMNTTIKNSIELDYRMEKDRLAAMDGDDDKRLMDMYNAFISSPVSANQKSLLGPTEQQLTLPNSNNIQMVEGTITSSIPMPVAGTGPNTSIMNSDPGFTNYIQNMTPEQNLMMYENNPDVKQVVVYNEETGERFFDVRNMVTGESIPNVSKHDSIFLEDTVIDKKRGIARNVNLGESYPLIVIGGNTNSSTAGF